MSVLRAAAAAAAAVVGDGENASAPFDRRRRDNAVVENRAMIYRILTDDAIGTICNWNEALVGVWVFLLFSLSLSLEVD